MLPLHHDPGRDISCRGIRLIQVIASALAMILPENQGGRIRTGGLKLPKLAD